MTPPIDVNGKFLDEYEYKVILCSLDSESSNVFLQYTNNIISENMQRQLSPQKETSDQANNCPLCLVSSFFFREL